MHPTPDLASPDAVAPPTRRRVRHWLAGFMVALGGLGVAGWVDANLTIETSSAESFEQVTAPPSPVATTIPPPSSTSTTAPTIDRSQPATPELGADALLLGALNRATTGTPTTTSPKPSSTTVLGTTKSSPATTAAPTTTTTAAPPSTAAPATTAAPTTTTTAAPPSTAAPAPTAAPDSSTTTVAPVGELTLSAADLEQLRACESGGNYQAVNPRGPYLGAYQFLQSTWNWVAGAVGRSDLVGVSPAAASAADQDAMATGLWTLAGPGQWPSCGRHLPPQP